MRAQSQYDPGQARQYDPWQDRYGRDGRYDACTRPARLEAGTFAFPAAEGHPARVTLRAAELAMLLDGVDWQNVRRRRRYRRPAPA